MSRRGNAVIDGTTARVGGTSVTSSSNYVADIAAARVIQAAAAKATAALAQQAKLSKQQAQQVEAANKARVTASLNHAATSSQLTQPTRQAPARSPASSGTLCNSVASRLVGGGCTAPKLSPDRPGGAASFGAGLGSSILGTLQSGACLGSPLNCLANQVLGVPSIEGQYQSVLHSLGVDTSPGSTYTGGQVGGFVLSLAAGGALGEAGAAGDATTALSDIAEEGASRAASRLHAEWSCHDLLRGSVPVQPSF